MKQLEENGSDPRIFTCDEFSSSSHYNMPFARLQNAFWEKRIISLKDENRGGCSIQ